MDESAGTQEYGSTHPTDRGPGRFARPVLIASGVVAVVCLALLVIIFFLDTFNATVYSVGGNDIQDETQEAQDIRSLYSGARAGGIAVLAGALVAALAAGLVLYRSRNQGTRDAEGGEDVDVDDLGR